MLGVSMDHCKRSLSKKYNEIGEWLYSESAVRSRPAYVV